MLVEEVLAAAEMAWAATAVMRAMVMVHKESVEAHAVDALAVVKAVATLSVAAEEETKAEAAASAG